MDWVPIQYREFYDVPRMFVAEYMGRTYLFDGSFDDTLDEYPSEYAVCVLPRQDSSQLSGSWENLRQQALFECGKVRVSDVIFDVSRRAAVNSTVFDRVTVPSTPVNRAG